MALRPKEEFCAACGHQYSEHWWREQCMHDIELGKYGCQCDGFRPQAGSYTEFIKPKMPKGYVGEDLNRGFI